MPWASPRPERTGVLPGRPANRPACPPEGGPRPWRPDVVQARFSPMSPTGERPPLSRPDFPWRFRSPIEIAAPSACRAPRAQARLETAARPHVPAPRDQARFTTGPQILVRSSDVAARPKWEAQNRDLYSGLAVRTCHDGLVGFHGVAPWPETRAKSRMSRGGLEAKKNGGPRRVPRDGRRTARGYWSMSSGLSSRSSRNLSGRSGWRGTLISQSM